MKNYTPIISLFISASLLFVGCGSDSAGNDGDPDSLGGGNSPVVAADEVVFVWTETGGCAMGGPNCARFEVMGDGTVNTYREQGADVANSGTIEDSAVLDRWLAAVAETDLDELTARLGPGELTAAFDGVDYLLEAPTGDFEMSSVNYEFNENEPLLGAAIDLARAAAEAAPLEIEFRQ